MSEPGKLNGLTGQAFAALVGEVAAEIVRRLLVVAEPEATDLQCLDAREAAALLGCSPDLVRDCGEAWGIARVLSRDARGRASRVVYPRLLIEAFLRGHERVCGDASPDATEASAKTNGRVR